MTWTEITTLALTTVAIPAVLAVLGFAGWAVTTLLPAYLALLKSRLQNALNEGNAAVASRKAGEIVTENGGVAPTGAALQAAVVQKGMDLAVIRKDSLLDAGATNLQAQAIKLVSGEFGKLPATAPTP